ALLDAAMLQAVQQAKNNTHGQHDLFQFIEETKEINIPSNINPWTQEEKLQGENESLGMYFSGHPILLVQEELQQFGVSKFSKVVINKKEQKSLIAGIVLSIKTMQTKNGERMAIIGFDEGDERFEVAIFPQVYQSCRDLLVKDQLLIIEGTITVDPGSGTRKIRAQNLYGLDAAREMYAKAIIVKISNDINENSLEMLKECLTFYERGNCPIYVEYQNQDAKVKIKLGQQWNVKPSQDLVLNINTALEAQAATIAY
ncbi:MAG TPA: hypothetical protein PLD88_14150, partial [Candidatus Berkiella sp.]|nr:hypothetical protein [Candidatus Berkiella sp.]